MKRGPSAGLALLLGCSNFHTGQTPVDAGPSGDGDIIVIFHDAGDAAAHDDSAPHDAMPDVAPHRDGGATDGGTVTACDGSTCGIQTLVTNLNQAAALAVDDTNIYFADQGLIPGVVYQCPKTGCTTPIVLGPGYATGIGVDATHVYWNDFSGGTIVSCTIGGCANAPTVIAPNQPNAEGLSFDGTHLYWAATGDVLTCLAPGCASPATLATGQSASITTVASETGSAYWLSSGSLLGCGATGCGSTPRVVTSNAAGSSVAVKDGFAYFTNDNAVISCPTTSTCAFPQTVGSTFVPFGLASDGADVYWLDENIADVYRCPVTGCVGSAVVFADTTAVDPAGEIGANVALDGEYVYWADAASIFRKAK